MHRLIEQIQSLATAPEQDDAYRAWLTQEDALAFLRENVRSDEIIIYAGVPYSFMHGVLVPKKVLETHDIEDLLGWSYNPFSSWSTVSSGTDAWIEPPLSDCGSKLLATGEQIVFARNFHGVAEREYYFEISHPLTHTADIHFMRERNAWCRLDRHGDIEDVIRIIELPSPQQGTVVLARRDVLATYATLTGSSFARMFDFTRFRPGKFPGWGDHKEVLHSDGELHFRLGVLQGQASYVRGVQLFRFGGTKEEIGANIWPADEPNKKHVSFIALDRKTDKVDEYSCSPDQLANYFTKSDLPWEITPAFFRPEVLLRYKADRDKYTLLERSVSCRGAWYLETFDVNDAGQVHTYLIYLSRLPYEEQLHWRAHNEAPKGPMSERAIKGDINGEFYDEFNPLQSLKQKLSDMRRQHVPWWTLRATYLMDRSNYPFTPSTEEWADEILTLDQLVVEGFEETWLRRKAIELRRSPAANLRSLKLVEECLVGLGLEAQDAAAIVSPLHQLHGLRNKLKGHVTGKDAASIKSDALATYGTFRKHFIHLADECDQAIGTIFQLFSEDGRLRQ